MHTYMYTHTLYSISRLHTHCILYIDFRNVYSAPVQPNLLGLTQIYLSIYTPICILFALGYNRVFLRASAARQLEAALDKS